MVFAYNNYEDNDIEETENPYNNYNNYHDYDDKENDENHLEEDYPKEEEEDKEEYEENEEYEYEENQEYTKEYNEYNPYALRLGVLIDTWFDYRIFEDILKTASYYNDYHGHYPYTPLLQPLFLQQTGHLFGATPSNGALGQGNFGRISIHRVEVTTGGGHQYRYRHFVGGHTIYRSNYINFDATPIEGYFTTSRNASLTDHNRRFVLHTILTPKKLVTPQRFLPGLATLTGVYLFPPGWVGRPLQALWPAICLCIMWAIAYIFTKMIMNTP